MSLTGEKIKKEDGKLKVPSYPIIPYIEGDGVGPDIWKATKKVIDFGIEYTYNNTRKIIWKEILAGEKAYKETGSYLPEQTLKEITEHLVAIKGPLTTPVGGGYRSLNVTLRQVLDLYACVRPVRYFEGVPSPVKHPEKVDMVIFRENTEDVYAGIEWESNSPEAKRVIEFMKDEMGVNIQPDSGIGLKPISPSNTKRLVRMAIRYAIDNNRKSITLVHKGNIMKYTEGGFRKWGYEAAEEFKEYVIPESSITEETNIEDKIIIKDRIADAMFQQILTRPEEYDVLALPNLNGDYISDALAAQVGGIGMAPGANIGDNIAVFEATHGSAPKYAGMDKVNPSSLILSGVMLLEYIGWKEVAENIIKGMKLTFLSKRVTYDLHRLIDGAVLVKCSEFADIICENMSSG